MDAIARVAELFQFVDESREAPEAFISATRVSDSVALFTMYGTLVERFIASLMPIRALDQKGVADAVTRDLFRLMFKPETRPEFNASISVCREIIVDRLWALFEEGLEKDAVKRALQNYPADFYEFEIDGVLYLAVKASHDKLVEIKLSTAPLDDETKILRGPLQDAKLTKYFAVRAYLGLLCFSFVREGASTDPISPGTGSAYPHGVHSAWAVHLAFVDAGILDDGRTAPERAGEIHAAILAHQQELAARFLPDGSARSSSRNTRKSSGGASTVSTLARPRRSWSAGPGCARRAG